MTRLALRLTLAGWRAAPWRVALSVIGVGVAVVLVLATMSLNPALQSQSDRVLRRANPISEGVARPGDDVLLWRANPNADRTAHGGVTVIAVSSTGPRAPLPLGAEFTPKPGEVLVSPALRSLLASPEGHLYRLRLPGPVVGGLGRDALEHPSDLVMMVGARPEQLPGAAAITAFSDEVPPPPVAKPTRPRRLLTAVAGTGLLLPILAFVHASLAVSARRREERLAALRLVGATAGDVRRMSVTEAVIGAGLGVAAGLGAAALLRGAVADPAVAGYHFFSSDLSPSPATLVAVAVAVPLIAGVVGHAIARAVDASPLGVRRRARPRRRAGLRALPVFAAGWALLLVGAVQSRGLSITSLGLVVSIGFALVIAGFVGASPMVVRGLAAAVGAFRHRPALLLAARRLHADPAGAARAVGGIAVAALVAATALTYFPAHQRWARSGERTDSTPASSDQRAEPDALVLGPRIAALGEPLRSTTGVVDVIPVVEPAQGEGPRGATVAASCDRLLRALRVSDDCDPARTYASTLAALVADLPVLPAVADVFPPVVRVDPRAAAHDGGRVVAWIIATDGAPETAELIRATAYRAHPGGVQVGARTDHRVEGVSRSEADQGKLQLAAAFMFAVGTARFLLALVEAVAVRRRELSMLIAQGTDSAVLRRAAVAELGAPLAVLVVIGSMVGFLVAGTILATAGIAPAADVGALAVTIALFAALALAAVWLASIAVGRSFDVRALAGERA